MDVLKKIFPVSFIPKFTKDVGGLILGILAHFGAGIVCGIISGVLALIGIGLIIAPLVGLYLTAGIVIMILVFAKVIKPEEAPAVEAEATENTDAE